MATVVNNRNQTDAPSGGWLAQAWKIACITVSSIASSWVLEKLFQGGTSLETPSGITLNLSDAQRALASSVSCTSSLALGGVASVAIMSPLPLLAASSLGCITPVMADDSPIPPSIQKDLDTYLDLSLSMASQQASSGSSEFSSTFQKIYNPAKYIEENHPLLTSDQKRYLVASYTADGTSYIDAYLRLRKYNREMLNAELSKDGLEEAGRAFSYAAEVTLGEEKIQDISLTVALAAGILTEGAGAEPAYWLTQLAIKGVGESGEWVFDKLADEISYPTPPPGATYATVVFSPDFLSIVQPELQAYAQSGSAETLDNLKRALETVCYTAYDNPNPSSPSAAVRQKAFDYVIQNAAALLSTERSRVQIKRFAERSTLSSRLTVREFLDKQLAIACRGMGSSECHSVIQNEKLFLQLTSPSASNAAIRELLKKTHQKITTLKGTLAKPRLYQSQLSEYQDVMKDLEVGFKAAHLIAMLMGDSKTAAKIATLGQATLGIAEAFHQLTGIGDTLTKTAGAFSLVSRVAGALNPVLGIAEGIFQVFSLFDGGDSHSADQAIMQDLQRISQQLQVLTQDMRILHQEIEQGFEIFSSDFNLLFKNLDLLLDRITQGQEITEATSRRIESELLAFRLQTYQMAEEAINRPFIDARARFVAFAKSHRTTDMSPLRDFASTFYLSAAVHSRRGPATNGLMNIMAMPQETDQLIFEKNIANNLRILPPEASQQFYRNYAEQFTTKTLPEPVNALVWENAANLYACIAQGYGLKHLSPSAPAEVEGMIKAGIDLITFGSQIRNNTNLWGHLFEEYEGALKQLNNNVTKTLANEWISYATSDPSFKPKYLMPLERVKARLEQKIQDFQYNTTLMDQLFPGPGSGGCSQSGAGGDSLASIIEEAVFMRSSPVESVLNAVRQFSPELALSALFTRTGPNITFPCIAFGEDNDIKGLSQIPPLDVSSLIPLSFEIWQSVLTGVIKSIDFTYRIVGIISETNPSPHFDLFGTYTLKDGSRYPFVKGRFPFPDGPAGTVWPRGLDWKEPADLVCTVPVCKGADADAIISDDFAIQVPGYSRGVFASLDECLAFPANLVPALIFSCDLSCEYVKYLNRYPQSIPFFKNISLSIYQSLFAKTWSNLSLSTNTTSFIPDPTAWVPSARAKLSTLLGQQLHNIVHIYFKTEIDNPDASAYAPLCNALRSMEGSYNLIRGFMHFAHSAWLKGETNPNPTPLCLPINPWQGNSTAFKSHSGEVQIVGIPGQTSSMHSQYAFTLKGKEWRIQWSAPHASQAGLTLGTLTVAPADLSPNQPLFTRIKHINNSHYIAITAINDFDNRGGKPIDTQHLNTTQDAVKLGGFIRDAQGENQTLRITNATSLQLNYTIPPQPSDWNSINTARPTQFSSQGVTFYGVPASDSLGWSLLKTNHSLGVMNTHMNIVWKGTAAMASAGNPHNMTVAFDLGEQEGIVEFPFNSTLWKPHVFYYTTLIINSQTITCTTSQGGFGMPALQHVVRPNHFVHDFSTLAVRISDNLALKDPPSVTIQDVSVKGFNESMLPQPLSSHPWSATNSTRGIISSVEGVTITKAEGIAQTLLSSNSTFLFTHQELWVKWKVDTEAEIDLQLAGQSIVKSSLKDEALNVWHYIHITVFNTHVTLTNGTNGYNLNPKSDEEIRIPLQNGPLPIGKITWCIQSSSSTPVQFTLGECTIQSAEGTLVNQMLVRGGLMDRSALLKKALYNMSTPELLPKLINEQLARLNELREIVEASANSTVYPPSIDSDIASTMRRLLSVQKMLVQSQANITPFTHNSFPESTRTKTREHSDTKTPLVPILTQSQTETIPRPPPLHNRTLTPSLSAISETSNPSEKELTEILSSLKQQQVETAETKQLVQAILILVSMIGAAGALFFLQQYLRKQKIQEARGNEDQYSEASLQQQGINDSSAL